MTEGPYGRLTVICGPMFGGKTSRLLDLYSNYGGALFKPKFDVRYAVDDVVTHDGECIPANAISSIEDIAAVGEVDGPYFVDEAQFLDGDRYRGDFIQDVKLLLQYGVDFYVAGLDMNWRGDPFPVVAKLCGMADKVVKVTAYCSKCGSEAAKTLKKNIDDTEVELGSADIYEPRCNGHFNTR